MVETEHGNVEIAQETITNTVKSVAMKLSNVKDVYPFSYWKTIEFLPFEGIYE